MGKECIWASLDIGFGAAENVLDQLGSHGMGIADREIAVITFSVVMSLAGGLYRSAGAFDIDLHAGGWYVALALDASPEHGRRWITHQ